ncbi:MAG: hypothetical protein JSV00_06820, partial [bacterium]
MTPRCALACSLALSFLLALAGCGSSGGGGGGRAVATYCPLPYSQALPAAVAGANSPPRAYYQRLRVSLGDTLPITLFACDPDLGSSYTGLTWAVTSGPVSGGQLSAQAGTYAGEPFQVTYTPAQVGTDSFFYQVN